MLKRSYTDFSTNHFNIYPDTGDRRLFGQFSDLKEFGTTFLQRMTNLQSSLLPAPNYSSANITVDESEQRQGFRSADSSYKLMMRINNFTAVNAVPNINKEHNNNKFWVWKDWNGSIETLPSRIVWQSDIQAYELETAYYSSQMKIVSAMNALSSDVLFTFDPHTQYLIYNGTKPLILPWSTNFDPAFYKNRPNLSVTAAVGAFPSNVHLNVDLIDPSNIVFDATVNGKIVEMFYYDPAFVADYLAYKLGFACGSKDNKIQLYFNYPNNPLVPNSPNPDVTTPLLNGQTGSIAMIIYPGARSGPGDIYGPLKSCLIKSKDVISATDGTNVLAAIDVAGEVEQGSFQVTDFPGMPIIKQNGSVETISLECVDKYNRPYQWLAGPPEVTLSFYVEKQM